MNQKTLIPPIYLDFPLSVHERFWSFVVVDQAQFAIKMNDNEVEKHYTLVRDKELRLSARVCVSVCVHKYKNKIRVYINALHGGISMQT